MAAATSAASSIGTRSGRRLSNLLGSGGTRIVGTGRDHSVRQGKQNLRHLADRLVPHGAENKRQRTLRIASREGRAQCPCPGWIVRHIEHIFGLARRWQVGPGTAPANAFPGCRARSTQLSPEIPAGQFFRSRNRQSHISQLVASDQRVSTMISSPSPAGDSGKPAVFVRTGRQVLRAGRDSPAAHTAPHSPPALPGPVSCSRSRHWPGAVAAA